MKLNKISSASDVIFLKNICGEKVRIVAGESGSNNLPQKDPADLSPKRKSEKDRAYAGQERRVEFEGAVGGGEVAEAVGAGLDH